MATNHDRPPNARHGRRHPPKGPRPVASTPNKLRTDLRAASQHLRDTGAPALARTVDSLLDPTGWEQLRRATGSDSTTARNVPIPINADLRATYQQAAEAAGSNLTSDVLEGLRAFIDGEFSPAGYPRRNPGTPDTGTFLNVRIPESIQEAVKATAEERKDAIGFKTTLNHVAKAWLAHKYAQQPAK
ncbi:hypothetical protein [Streptomyces gardneri]|uniref:hypothetical protein n=1 Tax=Streptomyces gardneri TaxID=66892 RepID=UPI00369F6D53